MLPRSRRRQVGDAETEPRQPDAEIGVLGDVPGVPGADGAQGLDAEMVRGAAERDGQAQMRKPRIDDVEEGRVFEGEEARQPGAAGPVVDAEAGLQAGDLGRRGGEGRGGEAELARIRGVLRIVDDEEASPRQRQGDVERPRLRARAAGRHDEDYDMRRQVEALQGHAGRGIVRFEHEHDVELSARIVEAQEIGDEAFDDLRLPVQGDEHRVGRQVRVRHARRGRNRDRRRHQRGGGAGGTPSRRRARRRRAKGPSRAATRTRRTGIRARREGAEPRRSAARRSRPGRRNPAARSAGDAPPQPRCAGRPPRKPPRAGPSAW